MQKIFIPLPTALTLISNIIFAQNCSTNRTSKNLNSTSFTKTGQVFANGTLNYIFNDATPFDGVSYYRVKRIDKSGK
jgi:hypothetical protein